MNENKNTPSEFSLILVDYFYTHSQDPNFAFLSDLTGLSLAECKNQWNELSQLSALMAQLPSVEPSPWAVTRLKACARETQKPSFFKVSFLNWRWSLGFSFILLVAVVGYLKVSSHSFSDKQMAQQTHESLPNPAQTPHTFQALPSRIINSFRSVRPSRSASFSPATPVSLGGPDFSNDLLESENLYKENLNPKEIESLIFRAKKFEKQGFFKEALRDYQFLSQSKDHSIEPQILHLAMARCLERLGQEKTAIHLLEKSKAHYGESEDLRIMIEQLKSVSF